MLEEAPLDPLKLPQLMTSRTEASCHYQVLPKLKISEHNIVLSYASFGWFVTPTDNQQQMKS